LRLEYHDTLPAVAAVFGFVVIAFAGAVYGLHSLMQPTILKHRGISFDSPPATSAAAPQTETRQGQAPPRERQVRARTMPAWNASPSYGSPF
jgi:hypothetical protein